MLATQFSTQNYLPPLWQSLDTIEDDVPELSPGMLVEWTNYDDETEIGIGIIKLFTTMRFYDYDNNEYVNLPCAYVVNANPADPYGYYIPMTHMDVIDLPTYISIYEDEYDADLQELQTLRYAVARKMQVYGWERGHGNMQSLLHHPSPVPFPVTGGAQ